MASEKSRKFEYGCLMTYFDFVWWDHILGYVEDSDVYYNPNDNSFGLEHEPHATILFGLEDYIPDSYISKAVEKIKPVPIQIQSISAFTDNEEYDVLKFDVNSPYLHFLNRAFKKFPHHSSYPIYNPHITVAYLKKGKYKKYLQIYDKLPNYRYVSDEVVYSKVNGQKIKFNLK